MAEEREVTITIVIPGKTKLIWVEPQDENGEIITDDGEGFHVYGWE